MGVIGIIPARAGSVRIPGKNKKLFCGRPLIDYVLEQAKKSKLLDALVLNTDDPDILAIGKKRDVKVIERPIELAQKNSRAIEFVEHTLTQVDPSGDLYNIVVIVQPTSPLTLADDIDGTISMLLNSNADSAVSVKKLSHDIHPFKMKLLDEGLLVPYIEEEKGRMASDQLSDIFVRNGSVYASRIETILKGDLLGNNSAGYIMPAERSVDINDPIDFAFAEFLYKDYCGNN